MSNIDRHPECHMRTALGNCDPIGGFCTSVNESVCEGLHKVSRPQGHYIKGRNGEWYCSECKRIDDKYSVARFCWYCGAQMKGAE